MRADFLQDADGAQVIVHGVEIHAAEIFLVSGLVDPVGELHVPGLGRRESEFQTGDDLPGHAVFHGEQLFVFDVDGVAPDDSVGADIDELRGDPKVVAILEIGAGEQRIHVQLGGRLSRIDSAVAITLDGRRRPKGERTHGVGKRKPQKIGVRIWLQVAKRQNGQTARRGRPASLLHSR